MLYRDRQTATDRAGGPRPNAAHALPPWGILVIEDEENPAITPVPTCSKD